MPDELLPELVELIAESGTKGLDKLVNEFYDRHNEVSKRQIEVKINEVAFKARGANNGPKVWCIRSGAALFLAPGVDAIVRDPPEDVVAAAPMKLPPPPMPSGSPAHGAPPLERASSSSGGDLKPSSSSSAKRKSADAGLAPKKRKRSESAAAGGGAPADGAPPEPPKKAASALKLFGKKMHKQIKAMYPDADKAQKVAYLKEMWRSLPPEEVEHYQEHEAKDRQRYDREYDEYLKAMESYAGGALPLAAEGGSAKRSSDAKRAVL
uniref:HMG box domain-containing protein n=1 Tax=Phaeomonas parva TaxID=124430 RepID=A0A7S1Y0P3_9STRA